MPGPRQAKKRAKSRLERRNRIFIDALDDTLALVEIAEPEEGTTPTITPITDGKRRPKPIEEKVASDRMLKQLPRRDWRAKVDDNGEAFDRGFRNPSEPRKLRNQLTALIKAGRTFAHSGTPLSWTDVTRLVTLGRRRLREVYGDDSPPQN